MNDYRAASQELQGQVLAAARKGQERVTKSVKNVTAQIRPQLASLPKPKAPELVAKLPAKLPTLPARLQVPTRLPSPDQLRAGAQELAGHARTVRRMVTGQMMSVATPLAHQAAARLAQVGTAAEPQAKTTTRVREVTVAKDEKPADPKPATAKTSTAATSTPKTSTPKTGSTPKAGSTAKPAAAKTSTTSTTSTTRKPKADPAGK
jgi:hypothetical protein